MYPLDIGSFKIGSMEIFNEINHPEIIDHLMEFEANALINDTLLKDALQYSIFQLLSKFNADKPISAFFQKFSQALGKNIKKPRNVIQNEADIIEFKSGDYMVGSDNEIIERISKDILKKTHDNPFKIYIFGVGDKSKRLEPITSDKFNNDRIGSIEAKI